MKVKIHIVNKFVLLAKGQLICMPTLHQILTLSFCAFGKSFDLQIPIINDETQRTMDFSGEFLGRNFDLFIVFNCQNNKQVSISLEIFNKILKGLLLIEKKKSTNVLYHFRV